MKIAIINSNAAISVGGGVRLQGIMWHDGLVKLGHKCDLPQIRNLLGFVGFCL